MKEYCKDILVAVYDLDPIIYENLGERFDYRVEIFERNLDSKFYVKMWRKELIRVQMPFGYRGAPMPDGIDITVHVQDHDGLWDDICEDSADSVLEKVICIINTDFL